MIEMKAIKDCQNSLIIVFLLLIVFLLIFNQKAIYAQDSQTEYLNLDTSEEFVKNDKKKEDFKWREGKLVEPIKKEGLLPIRGMDFYPYPHQYSNKKTLPSLDALLRVKEVNWVQLRFFLYQDDEKGNEVYINEDQDKILREMIRKIHKTGRKVSLQPHLLVEEYRSWGGVIEPTDIDEWFSSYSKAFMHYVKIAEEENVELLLIGNEYITMWKYSQKWEELIEKIRKEYSGEITAKINCWWQEEYIEKVMKWNWMRRLDYIGISPYFDLIRKKEPSLEEIKNSWADSHHGFNIVKQLEKISNEFGKDILFLEIGYRSIQGTVMEPWNYRRNVPTDSNDEAIPSERQQTLATQALFDVFLEKEWFKGVFLFLWPTEIIVDPESTDWTIPGKEVEEIIWDNYRRKR